MDPQDHLPLVSAFVDDCNAAGALSVAWPETGRGDGKGALSHETHETHSTIWRE